MIADLVQQAFLQSKDEKQIRRGERMLDCAPYLIFKILNDPESVETEKFIHRLRYAHFCKVRLCPICMWRRSLAWRARFFRSWDRISREYPKARYFHLVLTVPNCEIKDLRSTIDKMNQAWHRMVSRKTWPAMGFLRSFEVTRSKNNLAHPHIHALMMVNASYFSGQNYMNRDDWRKYWLTALGVSVDLNYIHPFVRAVKEGSQEEIGKAVLEVAKYALKFDSSSKNGGIKKASTGVSMEQTLKTKPGRLWFLELDKQLESTKSVTLGGVLKDFVKDDEFSDEELLQQNEAVIDDILNDFRYDWLSSDKAYLRTKILSQVETQWWNKQEEKWKNAHINKGSCLAENVAEKSNFQEM
jgi:plasmid rolling circle replication initiator protein Rep